MKNFILFCALFLVSCGAGNQSAPQASMDTLYAPRYARHFVVLHSGDSVVLRVKNPYQGAAGVSVDYSLAKADRIVCMSSSHAAFLDTLGAGGRVVGVSAPQYYSSPRFARLPDVGYDNSLNVELIASLGADIITAYALTTEKNPMLSKAELLGVRPIYVADYLEDTPLARAEWVVAFGALVGRQKVGESIFEGIEKNYIALRDSVQGLKLCPRKVMLNSPYKGVWYLPGDSSFIVRMIVDAGGEYVARGMKDNLSHAVSSEVAYARALQAQVWINPSANITRKAQIIEENDLLSNVNIPIYNNTLRSGKAGGSDFWESGVLRADLALRDMVKIFHTKALPNHRLYYYYELR
ncbi:MAG: ABC transporter substrate-binding protein [Mucinivorans sp.]